MMTFNYCMVCLLFTLCLPLLACRLLELFFLVKFVAILDLASLFRFAWRCDIFPSGFVKSFAEDFLLFLKFPPESNIQASLVINYLSVTHSTTDSHIPQFSVAGYFDELLLSIHLQFELVPCSHTGRPRFRSFFSEIGLGKQWITNCSSPTGAGGLFYLHFGLI
jgi:hypothetical protein